MSRMLSQNSGNNNWNKKNPTETTTTTTTANQPSAVAAPRLTLGARKTRVPPLQYSTAGPMALVLTSEQSV